MALKINTKIDYDIYRINHRGECCKCSIHSITDKNIQTIVCAYLNPKTRLDIIYKYGNISNWNVSKVTNMYRLFDRCEQFKETFDEPLNKWNVSNVTNMVLMFAGCTAYNHSIRDWNVSSIKDNMYDLFGDLTPMCNNNLIPSAFDKNNACVRNINDYNIRRLVDIYIDNEHIDYYFSIEDIKKYYGIIDDWNVSPVTDMNKLFYNTDINAPISLSKWNAPNVVSSYNYRLFGNSYLCGTAGILPKNFINYIACKQDITDSNIHAITGSYTYEPEKHVIMNIYGPINTWDVSEVTNMELLFIDRHKFNEPLNNWNVSKVTKMNDMFVYCKIFNQSLSNWNVSKVIDNNNYTSFAYGTPMCSNTSLLPKGFIADTACNISI